LALLNDPLIFQGMSHVLKAHLIQALENQVLWEICQSKRWDKIVELIPGEMPEGDFSTLQRALSHFQECFLPLSQQRQEICLFSRWVFQHSLSVERLIRGKSVVETSETKVFQTLLDDNDEKAMAFGQQSFEANREFFRAILAQIPLFFKKKAIHAFRFWGRWNHVSFKRRS
jgi:hypothetical protein